LMPSSRAARMMATPVSAGSRSYVRHEPGDNADTSIPAEPSGRELSKPADILPPSGPLALSTLNPYHPQAMPSTPAGSELSRLLRRCLALLADVLRL